MEYSNFTNKELIDITVDDALLATNHPAIDELRKRLNGNEWIPVTPETMPEEDLPVLGTFAGKPAVDTCCYADGKWWQVGHEILVTHWQPLPLPPQEQP
jgi:hypothetical protein